MNETIDIAAPETLAKVVADIDSSLRQIPGLHSRDPSIYCTHFYTWSSFEIMAQELDWKDR
jgi:hypothetical protein